MKWILFLLWIPIILAFVHAFYPSKYEGSSSVSAKLMSFGVGIYGIWLFVIMWI